MDTLKLTREQLIVIEEALMFYSSSYKSDKHLHSDIEIAANVAKIEDVQNLIFNQVK